MIPLKCILEYAIAQGQSYDLGKDFSNFQQTLDGTTDKIKQKFEAAINSQLKGKRIRARASRGYKQFEKDYEFDVSRVTIDDYYDNFVVVAHDETKGGKPKEYFLKPASRIQIVGVSSGVPSVAHANVTSGKPINTSKQQPAAPSPRPMPSPVKEDSNSDVREAYSINDIEADINHWIKSILKDTRISSREFVKSLGWKKTLSNGNAVAVYDIAIPSDSVRVKLNKKIIDSILQKLSMSSKNNVNFQSIKFDDAEDVYKIRIKKIITRPNTGRNI
jgi:membrane-bound lytic murein transglycosylase